MKNRNVSNSDYWPKYPGLVGGSCTDHGEITPISVNGYPWCPRCFDDGPNYHCEDDTLIGPTLSLRPDQPINYITVDFKIGVKTDATVEPCPEQTPKTE